MHLPDFLKIHQKEAESILHDGFVKQVEFSGGTYQVQVFDSIANQDVWAFLQLDPRGRIRDSFCSCETSDDPSSCSHIAAAFLKIFNGHALPLHQRFEKSLWNKLCYLFFDLYGGDLDLLRIIKDKFSLLSSEGREVFWLKGTKEEVHEILLHRKKETEETSLKFSNLSQDEILLWREGRPSPKLSYQLSYWYDLAKLLMMKQDADVNYNVDFTYSAEGLPDSILIGFPAIKLWFNLPRGDLPALIPAFSTINSGLAVHYSSQEAILKVVYDKERVSLLIQPNEEKGAALSQKGGIICGKWIFIPKKGFYSLDKNDLLERKTIPKQEISDFLDEHHNTIKELLSGAKLRDEPVELSYQLDFDRNWNLHVKAYLFTPGDLSSEFSHLLGNWVYLDGDGFYKVEGNCFDSPAFCVPAADVGEFIRNHRGWLNAFEGFHTHLASIEAQLAYTVTDENQLQFYRTILIPEEEHQTKDFGQWIYIAGQGFYSKTSSHSSAMVKPGIEVSEDKIPLFIRNNREELLLVQGFFSEQCPVEKASLQIDLREDGLVHVLPVYNLYPDYQTREVRHFEEYVYVPGEGFHELPASCRLPEKYRQPVFIYPSEQAHFILHDFVQLQPFASKVNPRLIRPSFFELEAYSLARNESGFEIKLRYKSDLGVAPLSELFSQIKSKKRFLFSDAGLIDLFDKRFKWLSYLKKENIDRRSNTARMTSLELLRLGAIEHVTMPPNSKGIQVFKELMELKSPEKPDLAGLTSSLRSYQLLGVQWLWFLYKHELSGLLCDDMGLGKTHQAMALFAAICNDTKKNPSMESPRFLVVCPTSVLYHWEEKLREFLPGIRVCVFYGSERSIEEFNEGYDLLLTSYGVLRLEAELLKDIPFKAAIFDEIQVAKNYASRVHGSLQKINAGMRLGLTGTPIENRLRELKSLFDIILPGYMPSEEEYREFFVKPIEREHNPERRQFLSRLIKPFVLRRKKGDVLLDLPEKTEEVAHCDLSPNQKELYRKALQTTGKKLVGELQDKTSPIPYMHVFSLLSSLKQICDHPAVYLKHPEEYKKYHSGKWELFLELLNEARESQQKVVVFSQYLGMLDIFEEYLNEQGIGFATIRGSTSNRGDQLARFNQDPECEVFLGSLQASGLGVDLTAASVVIHYDRWWNAARENQATDRVHRIGQTRGVQVFKLVTKGTFEEKIDIMISRKGKLMEDVIGKDDHEIVKTLNREDLIQLLQGP